MGKGRQDCRPAGQVGLRHESNRPYVPWSQSPQRSFLGLDDRASHVVSAVRAGHVGGCGLATPRAVLQLSRREAIVRAALAAAGVGVFSFRDGHRSTHEGGVLTIQQDNPGNRGMSMGLVGWVWSEVRRYYSFPKSVEASWMRLQRPGDSGYMHAMRGSREVMPDGPAVHPEVTGSCTLLVDVLLLVISILDLLIQHDTEQLIDRPDVAVQSHRSCHCRALIATYAMLPVEARRSAISQ